jgi:hypothetical protein
MASSEPSYEDVRDRSLTFQEVSGVVRVMENLMRVSDIDCPGSASYAIWDPDSGRVNVEIWWDSESEQWLANFEPARRF